jgi:hypothetical protein
MGQIKNCRHCGKPVERIHDFTGSEFGSKCKCADSMKRKLAGAPPPIRRKR